MYVQNLKTAGSRNKYVLAEQIGATTRNLHHDKLYLKSTPRADQETHHLLFPLKRLPESPRSCARSDPFEAWNVTVRQRAYSPRCLD